MNDNIKLIAKTSAKATGRWILVMVIGAFMFFIAFFIAIALLNNNIGGGFAGARAGGIGAILGIFVLFAQEFFTALLLFGSFAMLFLYTMAANKSAMQIALHQVWQNKGTGFIAPRITALLKKFQGLQGVGLLTNALLLKTKMLQQNGQDKSVPAIQRRIVNFGLKKIKLENIEVQNAQDLPALFTHKIEDKISQTSKPTFKPLGILLLIHVALIVLALIFDHK